MRKTYVDVTVSLTVKVSFQFRRVDQVAIMSEANAVRRFKVST